MSLYLKRPEKSLKKETFITKLLIQSAESVKYNFNIHLLSRGMDLGVIKDIGIIVKDKISGLDRIIDI